MGKQIWDSYYEALRQEDWETAKRALEKLRGIHRQSPNVHMKLGDLFERIGDAPKAIAAYHQSAWILREQGVFQKALALYKIILGLDPFDDEATQMSKELMWTIEEAKKNDLRKLQSETSDASIQEGAGIYEISRIPSILDSLPRDVTHSYLQNAIFHEFLPGQTVIEEGDTGNSIYFIDSGTARVVANILKRETELAVLSAGDIFGEVAFITGRPRTASVVAIDMLKVIEFNDMLLDKIFRQYPDVLEKIHIFYTCRVQDTILKVKSQMKKGTA